VAVDQRLRLDGVALLDGGDDRPVLGEDLTPPPRSLGQLAEAWLTGAFTGA
jgi:hypothetical protein